MNIKKREDQNIPNLGKSHRQRLFEYIWEGKWISVNTTVVRFELESLSTRQELFLSLQYGAPPSCWLSSNFSRVGSGPTTGATHSTEAETRSASPPVSRVRQSSQQPREAPREDHQRSFRVAAAPRAEAAAGRPGLQDQHPAAGPPVHPQSDVLSKRCWRRNVGPPNGHWPRR